MLNGLKEVVATKVEAVSFLVYLELIGVIDISSKMVTILIFNVLKL